MRVDWNEDEPEMLLVAFERATHTWVDLRRRRPEKGFFCQRDGSMNCREGRPDVMFLPMRELRRSKAVLLATGKGGKEKEIKEDKRR